MDVKAKVKVCSECSSLIRVVNGVAEVDEGHKIVLMIRDGETGMPTAMAHAPWCSWLPPEDMLAGDATVDDLLT